MSPQAPASLPWRRRHVTGLLFATAIFIGGALGITHNALDSQTSAPPTATVESSMLSSYSEGGDAANESLQDMTPQAHGSEKPATAYDPPPAAEPAVTASLACKAAQVNAVLSFKKLDAGALNQALTVAAICTITGK